MNCFCDYEPSDVWVEKIVKARKQHRCCECGGVVKPGETYRRASSLYDGQWARYIRCGDCAVIVCDMGKLADSNDGCFCNLWGGLREEMENYAGDCGEVELADLAPVFAAFNAASKQRGGAQLSTIFFES